MKKRLLREAVEIAKGEIATHSQYDAWLHWSFIVQHGDIINHATNLTGSINEPFFHMYNKRLEFNNTLMAKIHAEVNVFRKTRHMLGRDPFQVINIRMSRAGELKISKPCKCCFSFLKVCNCSEIYFSTDAGFAKIQY